MSSTNYALIRFQSKKPKMSARRPDIEADAQRQYDDAGLHVHAELFSGRGHPVRAMLGKWTRAYQTWVALTAPMDRGSRIVRADRMRAAVDEIERAIDEARAARDALLPTYDDLVQADIERRGSGASVDDYPSTAAIAAVDAKVGIAALPSAHPLATSIEVAEHETMLAESVRAAEAEMVRQIIERMERGAHALGNGERANIRSLTGILTEITACERVIHIDPTLAEKLATIRTMVAVEAGSLDTIRNNPDALKETSERIHAHAKDLAAALDF